MGTSVYGGTAGKGEIYQVKGSQFKVLYSFCTAVGGTCDDGLYPESRVTVDSSGRLYGTTLNGGQYNRGVVYRFTR